MAMADMVVGHRKSHFAKLSEETEEFCDRGEHICVAESNGR